MKTNTRNMSIHAFPVCFALTIACGASAITTNNPSDILTVSLQTMQETLEQQHQRIERIYNFVEPFLDEIGREGQQLERPREEAEERDFDRSIDQTLSDGDYQKTLGMLDDELQNRQAQILQIQYRLFNLSGCLGDWNRCLKQGQALMELPSSQHDLLVMRGCALAALLIDDRDTYDAVCSRVISEYGETEDPSAADRSAKVLLLTPESSPQQMDSALRLVDIALEDNLVYRWFRLVKGIAEYRSNHADEAVQWLDALRTNDDSRIASLSGYFTAMAQYRLNQPELAETTLSSANIQFDSILEKGNLGVVAGEKWWFDAAACILIRAEAEQMILGGKTSPRPTMESLAAARIRNAPLKPDSPETLVGQPIPGAFRLTLLDGGEFILPDEQNTDVLLLDFWATWCGPCRQVLPVLAEIAKDYADQGVRYVAVNLREKPEDIGSYLESVSLDVTVALDTDAVMANAFQVHGIPTMVVIDRNNIIRKVHVGSGGNVGKELRSALDELLSEGKTAAP